MNNTKSYVAMRSLKFGNGQYYIIRGKKYKESVFEFARAIAKSDSSLEFEDDDGAKLKISDDKSSENDYRKLFKVMKDIRY